MHFLRPVSSKRIRRNKRPAKAQPNAATTKDMVMAGPAFVAAATPVIENSPAPIIAPIPKAIKVVGAERTLETFFGILLLGPAVALMVS